MDSSCEPPAGSGVGPFVAAAAQVTAGLAAMAGCPMWMVGDADVLAGLDALMEGEARLAGVRARLIGAVQSRGLRTATGCTGPVALLRQRYRIDPRGARRLGEQAEAVLEKFPAVGRALADGIVHPGQAEAIVTGLAKLPQATSETDRAGAQKFLIGQAGSLEPLQLRTAANRLVEMLTQVSEDGEPPEETVADPVEKRSITFHRRGGGLAGQFFIPEGDAGEVAGFFAARAEPDSEHYGDPDHPDGYDTRRADQRNYDAVLAAIRHALGCTEDPGPRVPEVVIAMSYDWLLANLTGTTCGTGMTGTGTAAADQPTSRRMALPWLLDLDQPVSAAEARRLACDAKIIPAVLGSTGQVLDLGRAQRLFGSSLRRTLALRDQGCTFPGCRTPPIGCDGHHLVTPWQDLGPTCPENGTLLCPQHHRQVHRQHWTGQLDAAGNPQFVPPQWIDPHQRPRQHHRFALRTYPLRR